MRSAVDVTVDGLLLLSALLFCFSLAEGGWGARGAQTDAPPMNDQDVQVLFPGVESTHVLPPKNKVTNGWQVYGRRLTLWTVHTVY